MGTPMKGWYPISPMKACFRLTSTGHLLDVGAIGDALKTSSNQVDRSILTFSMFSGRPV
jgi:hypothetical protein